MTLVSGNQKPGDVFQMIMIKLTHTLQFVTRLKLIAWVDGLMNIVQTKMKAVKRNSISSVVKVKPAYQVVIIFLIAYIFIKWLIESIQFQQRHAMAFFIASMEKMKCSIYVRIDFLRKQPLNV